MHYRYGKFYLFIYLACIIVTSHCNLYADVPKHNHNWLPNDEFVYWNVDSPHCEGVDQVQPTDIRIRGTEADLNNYVRAVIKDGLLVYICQIGTTHEKLCKNTVAEGYWIWSCNNELATLISCEVGTQDLLDSGIMPDEFQDSYYYDCGIETRIATTIGTPGKTLNCREQGVLATLGYEYFVKECSPDQYTTAKCNEEGAKCEEGFFQILCGAHHSNSDFRFYASLYSNGASLPQESKELYDNTYGGRCEPCNETWASVRCNNLAMHALVECGLPENAHLTVDRGWYGDASGKCVHCYDLDPMVYCTDSFLSTFPEGSVDYYFPSCNDAHRVQRAGNTECRRCSDKVCAGTKTLIGCGEGRPGACSECVDTDTPPYLQENDVNFKYKFLEDTTGCEWTCMPGWTGFDCNTECLPLPECDGDTYPVECTAHHQAHCAPWKATVPSDTTTWVRKAAGAHPVVQNGGFDDFFLEDRWTGVTPATHMAQLTTERNEGDYVFLPNTHHTGPEAWMTDATVTLKSCLVDTAEQLETRHPKHPHHCDYLLDDKFLTVGVLSNRYVSLFKKNNPAHIPNTQGTFLDRWYFLWARCDDCEEGSNVTVEFRVQDGSVAVDGLQIVISKSVVLQDEKWTLVNLSTGVEFMRYRDLPTLTLSLSTLERDCEIAIDEFAIYNTKRMNVVEAVDSETETPVAIGDQTDTDIVFSDTPQSNGTWFLHTMYDTAMVYVDLEILEFDTDSVVVFEQQIYVDPYKPPRTNNPTRKAVMSRQEITEKGLQTLTLHIVSDNRLYWGAGNLKMLVLGAKARYIQAGIVQTHYPGWSCTQNHYLTTDGRQCRPCGTTHASCPDRATQKLISCSLWGLVEVAECVNCPTAPGNASYTYVPTQECSTVCNTGYTKIDGKCEACITSTGLCEIGQYLRQCSPRTQSVCRNCTNKDFFVTGSEQAYYTGYSVVYGENACPVACKEGYYKNGNACFRCTETRQCFNQFLQKCTAFSDSKCVECPNIGKNRRVLSESPAPGEPCVTECLDGFRECARCKDVNLEIFPNNKDYRRLPPWRPEDRIELQLSGEPLAENRIGYKYTYVDVENEISMNVTTSQSYDARFKDGTNAMWFNVIFRSELWITLHIPEDATSVKFEMGFTCWNPKFNTDMTVLIHEYEKDVIWWDYLSTNRSETKTGVKLLTEEKIPECYSALYPLDLTTVIPFSNTWVTEGKGVLRLGITPSLSDSTHNYFVAKDIRFFVTTPLNTDCIECDRSMQQDCESCDNIEHPVGSSTYSFVGDLGFRECGWECPRNSKAVMDSNSFTGSDSDMVCITCEAVACPVGEYQINCSSCAPCTMPAETNGHAGFTSAGGVFYLEKGEDGTLDEEVSAGEFSCEYECDSGTWRNRSGGCNLCSNITCTENQTWLVPCDGFNDAFCRSCTEECPPGTHPVTACTTLQDTGCGQCQNMLPERGVWKRECEWECANTSHTYRDDTHTCFTCEPECNIGYYTVQCAADNAWSGCRQCALPRGPAVAISSGVFRFGCQWRCAEGYTYNGKDECIAETSIAPPMRACKEEMECPLGNEGKLDHVTGDCVCAQCPTAAPQGTWYVHQCEWACVVPRIRNGDSCVILTVAGELVLGGEESELAIELMQAVSREPELLMVLGILLPVAGIMLLVAICTLFPRNRRKRKAR